jgi:hypothetical protein
MLCDQLSRSLSAWAPTAGCLLILFPFHARHVGDGALFAATEYGGSPKHTFLCSCLLLLRLDRMREVGWLAGNKWMTEQVRTKDDFGGAGGGGSDQGFINWVRNNKRAL